MCVIYAEKQASSKPPEYTEHVLFETANFQAIKGWLTAWSRLATPEFYVKSKHSGNIIKTFGRQSMSESEKTRTEERTIAACKRLEKIIFG
jgi:aminoglycoside/choline kinase family phosphotransferase